MSTRKIMEIVAICMAVLVIIGIFVPYASSEGYYGDTSSVSFWDAYSSSDKHTLPIIMIIAALSSAIVLLLQVLKVMKDSKESYIGAGFVALFVLYDFITAANVSFRGCSIGFWMMSLCGFALLIVSVIANYVSDEAKPKPYGYGYNQYGQPNGYNPMGYQNPQGGYPQQGGYNPQGPMYR